MEPEPKTPPPDPSEAPKESAAPENAEQNPAVSAGENEIPLTGPFTEEQQQYLSGFIAGMNAGLLVLGKKPIMDQPEEKTGS